MKYERGESFKVDYRRLSEDEKKLFRDAAREFNAAVDRFAEHPSEPWPASLRVKSVQGHPGVLEMTWSFSGPDGRATWEWIDVDGERAVRWRRIGGHDIFKRP